MNEEELNLDLDNIEANADKTLQVKNRFQQLANDKRTLAQEKEVLEKSKAEAEVKASNAEKSLEFYKNFSQLSAKHPEAINFQEQILERVNKGYDPEEATLAVLAKEGKLGFQVPPPSRQSAEGGSAITNVTGSDKPLEELTTQEKRSALQDMEKSGELIQALRAGINRS